MYNRPEALVMATVELDMSSKKKNRYLDQISVRSHFFSVKGSFLESYGLRFGVAYNEVDS